MPDTRKPTRNEILAMPAGHEMDRLVAVHVIGWHETAAGIWLHDKIGERDDLDVLDAYTDWSTNMAFAWRLAEKHRIGVVPARNLTENRDGWAASRFTGPDALFDNLDMASQIELFEEWVYGDTAPHAICRALLLGVCDG